MTIEDDSWWGFFTSITDKLIGNVLSSVSFAYENHKYEHSQYYLNAAFLEGKVANDDVVTACSILTVPKVLTYKDIKMSLQKVPIIFFLSYDV